MEPTAIEDLAIVIHKNNESFSPNGGINVTNDTIGRYLYSYTIDGDGIAPGDTIIEEISGRVANKITRISTTYLIAPKSGVTIANPDNNWGTSIPNIPGPVKSEWFNANLQPQPPIPPQTGWFGGIVVVPAKPVDPGWFGNNTRPRPPR